jgi:hypothetical protein
MGFMAGGSNRSSTKESRKVMLHKYFSRLTSSARGEMFNPLIWPFLISTFAYGLGFAIFLPLTNMGGESSLFDAMNRIDPIAPVAWGIVALLTIIMGLSFLMFNIPPFGKVSGLVGFGLWEFAAACYAFNGDWLTLVAVTVPNMIFWFWQYLSLSRFRAEDAEDKETMEDFDDGAYDE